MPQGQGFARMLQITHVAQQKRAPPNAQQKRPPPSADDPRPGPPMSLANMRANGVRAIIATCEACTHSADVNVDALPETVTVPKPASAYDAASAAGSAS
jgi:hypothetical protein